MRITRTEWRWVLVVSFGVLLLSTIPYLAGYVSQTPDLRFGGAVFDRMDYDVHLATIQIGLHGEWLYSDLHTSETVPPAFVRSFYIFLGQLGRIIKLSAPTLFEIARWMCGLWMLLTMYAMSAKFLWSISLRRIAFLFCALGSGVGWLMLLIQWQPQSGVSPIDFWLLDLYGFFSLLTFPHITTVMALSWTTVLVMLTYWETGKKWLLPIGILALVIAQIIQPFAPFVVDVVLTLYAAFASLIRCRPFPLASLTLLGIPQIPIALYSAMFFFRDPIWQSFTQQNVTLSPSPIYYVLGLGIIGVLALWGAWRMLRRQFSQAHMLVIWLIVVAVLVYLPMQFQRRLAEGLIGPVSILAAMGLGYGFLPALKRWNGLRRKLAERRYPFSRARNLIVFLVVATTTLSTMYLVFGGALLGVTRLPKLFDSGDVVQAVDWLGANSDWQATIWSAERTGMMIPARIGHRVYLGHQFETAFYDAKIINVARFYDARTSDSERSAFLRECGCRFVFFGPTERALGDFDAAQSASLQSVFQNSTVTIFRVLNAP